MKDRARVIVNGRSTDKSFVYETVILKPSPSIQEQIVNENTKYVIKWNFDLEGETLEIPENCIIAIDGGSISNGTLVGNDTVLVNVNNVDDILVNIDKQGTWKEQIDSLNISIAYPENFVPRTDEHGDLEDLRNIKYEVKDQNGNTLFSFWALVQEA